MVSALAVILAAVLQLSNTSLFLQQPTDRSSPAPPMASWIFLLGTLLFCLNMDFLPERYLHSHQPIKAAFEVVVCIVLAEVSSIVIWRRLEHLMSLLVQHAIHLYTGEGQPPLQCALLWPCDLVGLTVLSNVFAIVYLCFAVDATCALSNLFAWLQELKQLIMNRKRPKAVEPCGESENTQQASTKRTPTYRCCIGCSKRM